MPRFGTGRHGYAFVLLIAGSLALFSAQHVLGTAADAQTTEAVVDAHNVQPLPDAIAPVQASQVDAATVNGQFEELVESAPVPTVEPTAVPTVEPTAVPTVAPTTAPTAAPQPKAKLFEAGIASTYGEGDGFEGNRTACGQVFHTNEAQIAHKTLPCGTMVRVEDVANGRSVIARVTDRGPYVPGRIVDLSWGAFKQLEPNSPGLLRVNLYLLDQ